MLDWLLIGAACAFAFWLGLRRGGSSTDARQVAFDEAARIVAIDALLRFIEEHGTEDALSKAERAVNDQLQEYGMAGPGEHAELVQYPDDDPARLEIEDD